MELELQNLPAALFEGIEPENRMGMLGCTGYHILHYGKGQTILLEEENVDHIGIILEGAVDMVKEDLWGNPTILARMGKDALFGETFACGEDTRATVSFVAAESCRVLFIPFHKIMHTCTMACEFHHRLIENMVRIIAEKNRELLHKVEVVSQKSLREKLLTYLSVQAQKQGSRYFQIPLDRAELAQYLCADRSAVSRELSAMKAAGLIDYQKDMFRIL